MATLKNLDKFSVLILSAGRGTRLGKIGKKIPKSLLKINSKTILSRIIGYLISKGLKELNIVVGYKYKKILEELNQFDGLKVNYIKVKDYINNGSSYSWFQFKKLWSKKKKPLLIMHSDIIFDSRFIENILKSKKPNIIGVKKERKKNLKKKSFVVAVDKNMEIESIGLNKKISRSYGEIICINKFSSRITNKIFKFINQYFKVHGSGMTWEYIIDDFIKNNKLEKIYVLKNQIYKWANINTVKDLSQAKKLFNRI